VARGVQRSIGQMPRSAILLAILFLHACRAPAPADPDEVGGVSPATARERYVGSCGSCHGAEGRGDGPTAGALRARPTDLTRLAARRDGVFPRAEVLAILTGERVLAAHGSREMPVWSITFGAEPKGPTMVAAFAARRRLEGIIDHLERLQRSSE
jgi:mono/diheme cytochrome c family protein